MSFSEKDRNFRADSGKNFPIDPSAYAEAQLATVIADALRRDFGNTPHHVEHIARLTGMNPRTVKNWLQARNGPNGIGLILLMRHSDAVAAAVLDLADRQGFRRLAEEERIFRQFQALAIATVKQLDRS